MSQEAVERVLGRLITDARFRRAVGNSLETACVQQGYSLSLDGVAVFIGTGVEGD